MSTNVTPPTLDMDDPSNENAAGMAEIEKSNPDETDEEDWAGSETNPDIVASKSMADRAHDLGIYKEDDDMNNPQPLNVLDQLERDRDS